MKNILVLVLLCTTCNYENKADDLQIITNEKSLDIKEENVYTNLQEAFSKPKKVYKLDLSNKELTKYPSKIARLTNLRVLNLRGNNLKRIPSGIRSLSHLETLDLSSNRLVYLTPEIGKLKNLRVLHLGRYIIAGVSDHNTKANLLTKLPSEVGNLVNLEILWLNDNQLISLPPTIVNLINLQKLYIGGNYFTKFPAKIRELTNLKLLNLVGNYESKLVNEKISTKILMSKFWEDTLTQKEKEKIKRLLPNCEIEF